MMCPLTVAIACNHQYTGKSVWRERSSGYDINDLDDLWVDFHGILILALSKVYSIMHLKTNATDSHIS